MHQLIEGLLCRTSATPSLPNLLRCRSIVHVQLLRLTTLLACLVKALQSNAARLASIYSSWRPQLSMHLTLLCPKSHGDAAQSRVLRSSVKDCKVVLCCMHNIATLWIEQMVSVAIVVHAPLTGLTNTGSVVLDHACAPCRHRNLEPVGSFDSWACGHSPSELR